MSPFIFNLSMVNVQILICRDDLFLVVAFSERSPQKGYSPVRGNVAKRQRGVAKQREKQDKSKNFLVADAPPIRPVGHLPFLRRLLFLACLKFETKLTNIFFKENGCYATYTSSVTA